MKAACTPSSGCVWFDLKLPCQEAKCAICAVTKVPVPRVEKSA